MAILFVLAYDYSAQVTYQKIGPTKMLVIINRGEAIAYGNSIDYRNRLIKLEMMYYLEMADIM